MFTRNMERLIMSRFILDTVLRQVLDSELKINKKPAALICLKVLLSNSNKSIGYKESV